MKKQLLTIILALFSLSLFSQDNEPSYYYCYKLTSADWNNYTKKWDFNTPKSSTLTLKFYKNITTINDQAQSRYEAISDGVEKTGENYESKEWDGIDEKNRRVNLKIIKYTNTQEIVYMVVYDTYLIAYHINKSGLSPL